uniref:Centrosomal protein 95 n=1 Tax=Peromyscus maniculatus bairdii TaxID=230844 RepID=A0A8C8TRS5_PERMB
HIHLRIHELEDCDANVFIALYQSILGEKVPDLIAISRSQEDDAHNVQAVIDSLALDYLQVSLSHITGENIVKGDKESIKNLLEIFDGLLEYLTEHISETSHNKSETEQYFKDSHGEEPVEELESIKESKSSWRKVSFGRCSFLSDAFEPAWDEDEVESTGEVIRLGDTAHTFSLRSNAAETPSVSMVTSARKLGEPIRAAIPLHPPYHPSEPRAPCPIGKEYLRSSYYSSALTSGEHSELSVVNLAFENQYEVFVKPCISQFEISSVSLAVNCHWPLYYRNETRVVTPSEYSSSPQKARKWLTEQELHEVSEKLSQRLFELDWMLKSALGDRATGKTDGKDGDAGDEEGHSGKEERLSQHSDSVMEYGPKKLRPGTQPREALTEAFERELRKHKVQENVGLRGISAEEEEETEKTHREAIPKGTPKQSQVQKIYSRKAAAPSPKGGLLKSSKAAPMKVNEYSLLPLMLEQFPFLYVSDPTLTKMWKQQIAQVEQLKREAQREGRSKKKLQDQIEEALRRHDLLTALVKKEYEHNKRLQDFKDRIHRQRLTQSKIKENRQQIVRARKYYDDYRVQLRAKMMRMRTREEMIFKKLFEEGLQIQKQRLRDLRNYAKEKRNEEKRQHQNELDSMENYYKDQFSLLAEAISQERQELKAREKSQAQTLHKVKRELRAKMEKEIQQLQYMVTRNDEDAFFRELEAERFRARLQLASFQYSRNPFPRGQTS